MGGALAGKYCVNKTVFQAVCLEFMEDICVSQYIVEEVVGGNSCLEIYNPVAPIAKSTINEYTLLI